MMECYFAPSAVAKKLKTAKAILLLASESTFWRLSVSWTLLGVGYK